MEAEPEMEPVTSPKSWHAERGAATTMAATTNAARRAKAGRRDRRGIGAPADRDGAQRRTRTLRQAAPSARLWRLWGVQDPDGLAVQKGLGVFDACGWR